MLVIYSGHSLFVLLFLTVMLCVSVSIVDDFSINLIWFGSNRLLCGWQWGMLL